MKNIYALSLLCVILLASATDLLAWGQKGHDVTCEIAERHLDRGARKAVRRLLQGKSMVYWSNWLDNASHTPEYAYTKTCHDKFCTFWNLKRERAINTGNRTVCCLVLDDRCSDDRLTVFILH